MTDKNLAEYDFAEQAANELYLTVENDSNALELQYSFANDSAVYVSYEVPQAEYMYGCTATAVGMLIGYYDYYGYLGYKAYNLIDGTISLDSRGSDGNIYDMDEFNVLGSAIASREYVNRFYEKTPEEEFGYSFKEVGNELVLNTDEWNCLADYMGTGQFWRYNDDLSSIRYPGLSLYELKTHPKQETIESGSNSITIPAKYIDFMYGLSLYVEAAGYRLDQHASKHAITDNNGGSFSFEDYCAEIDAGRLVIIHIEGHSMVGYGYDKTTSEIIFDDTYENDQRMTWGGTYNYAGADRELLGISTIVFDTSNMEAIKKIDSPTVTPSTDDWTTNSVFLTANFSDESILNEYSFDGMTWKKYTQPIEVESNQTVYFRSKDNFNIYSDITEYEVFNIDTTGPVITITKSKHTATKDPITLTVTATDTNGSGVKKIEYSFDSQNWILYTEPLVIAENGIINFRAFDNVDNMSTAYENITVIDTTPPEKPSASANITQKTQENVIVTAQFSPDSVGKKYSYDQVEWLDYTEPLVFNEIGRVYFKAIDAAGNESEITEYVVNNIDREAPEITIITDNESRLEVAELTVFTNEDATIYFSSDNETWLEYTSEITIYENGTYYFKAIDEANNESTAEVTYNNLINSTPTNFTGSNSSISWESESNRFHLTMKSERMQSVLTLTVYGTQLTLIGLPYDTYECGVKAAKGIKWSDPINIKSALIRKSPKYYQAHEDGIQDVFFAESDSIWRGPYEVCHVGTKDGWQGTGESAVLNGKLQFKDIFAGTEDYSVLVLTDNKNGDAICLDDMFSDTPIENQSKKLEAINEILAGAGNDVIDMTSRNFLYEGSGMTIYGGSGNDVIWANRGENKLFGGSGSDRIVGCSDNDIIVGGTGNDILNGGGGEDIFIFGADFGEDIVKQIAGGQATFIFESEDVTWNDDLQCFTDGTNSVRLDGDFTVDVQYSTPDELAALNVFDDSFSEKIFNESLIA